jgi:aminoglycoside phosphotransferase
MSAHPDRPVTIHDDAMGRTVVAKRYLHADAATIYREHVALWRSTFGEQRTPPGLPAPLAFDAHAGVVTMTHVPGEPLATRGSVGGALDHAPAAARLLADLHRCGVQVSRRRGAAAVVRSVHRKAAEIGDEAVRAAYLGLAEELSIRAPADGALVVSHGDFSPRNVMRGPGGELTLIDFDRLQLASPARDVAYWGAWIWSTRRLCGDEPSWLPGDRFAVRYSRCAPELADEAAAGLAFHRAAALARIVHGWSALACRADVARQLLDDGLRLLSLDGSYRPPERQRQP